MTALQWVIGCGCITLQTFFHLLRLLGRWLGSTILIKLMHVKTQLVSQIYQWHTCWASLWKKNKKLELHSPRGICHLCRDKREELQHCSCDGALKSGGYWEECWLDKQALERCECKKTTAYELLSTGMVGAPAHVFTRYHEKGITRIRSHVYGEKGKLTKVVIGYDANSLYLCCSGDDLWQWQAGCEWEAVWSKTNCNIFKRRFKRESSWVCAGWYWSTQPVLWQV